MTVLEPPALDWDQDILDLAMAEAASLKIRTDLMLELQHCIQNRGWTPVEAAIALRQTSPQMQNLMNGELSRFTTEQLIQLLCKVGCQVRVSVTTPSH
ncbi:helix-turn-helix domain-containing protein [Leptolyngbya sp. PCC 6406]|uniref:helix-turn-helix domain-containing protein n=1 Tax=Leptolyngbya sp. PCC 6406 TaxID=1173264 RepID=UPI0002AC892C|nr:XRE family transcriptional regulator [Leptolyngbya sp. PCC 6406]